MKISTTSTQDDASIVNVLTTIGRNAGPVPLISIGVSTHIAWKLGGNSENTEVISLDYEQAAELVADLVMRIASADKPAGCPEPGNPDYAGYPGEEG